MSITTVIFDLGGVLVQTSLDGVTERLAELSGLTSEAVMQAVTGELGFQFMLGRFDAAEFHRRLTGQLGAKIDADDFLALWRDVIVVDDDATRPGGVYDIVTRLRGRYRLAVGSNTDELHYARSLELQPSLEDFDDVLLSYELGRCKPDPQFFVLGLRKLGVQADECVFIDDRPDNVAAASSLGIAGLHFTSAARLEADLTELGLL